MDNSNKKLSVIVPVYNVKEYLRRGIDSILAQDYEDLEVICVDDGATDGSGAVLDEYALKDSRIKVFHKENGGVVSARKAAMRMATGNYTAFVDPDDWIEQGMYKDMMAKMMENPVDLVASGVVRDYGSHVLRNPETTTGLYVGDKLAHEIKERLVDRDEPFHFCITPPYWNKIFRTELLKDLLLAIPDEVMMDTDTVCIYPYIMRSNGIYVMPKCYYHYCQRTDSCLNNTEMPDDVRFQKVKTTWKYGRTLLPPDLANYFEKYLLMTVCPKYAMRYGDGGLYPFGQIKARSRVVIYSSGSFGRKAKRFIEGNTDLQVVAWVDKSGDGVEILKPEQLPSVECDAILVCVLLSDIVADICKDFEKLGIDMRKVKCIRNV